jgi:hypothetical protein
MFSAYMQEANKNYYNFQLNFTYISVLGPAFA